MTPEWRSIALAIALGLLAGCGKGAQTSGTTAAATANEAATSPAAESTDALAGAYDNSTTATGHAAATGESKDYYVQLPLKEFMAHVMQYSGDGIWKRQGFYTDRAGQHSLFPKNDAEWEEAESGARTLAEVTNVLLLPGRRIDEPQWSQAVVHVRSLALQAAAAAEKHDQSTWFDIGGQLDEACDDCHKVYDPTFKLYPDKIHFRRSAAAALHRDLSGK